MLITVGFGLFGSVTVAGGACRVKGVKIGHISYNSRKAGPIVTEFGAYLETKQRYCILLRSWVWHICTCARANVPLFRISETAGQIALKFGVWLETH